GGAAAHYRPAGHDHGHDRQALVHGFKPAVRAVGSAFWISSKMRCLRSLQGWPRSSSTAVSQPDLFVVGRRASEPIRPTRSGVSRRPRGLWSEGGRGAAAYYRPVGHDMAMTVGPVFTSRLSGRQLLDGE